MTLRSLRLASALLILSSSLVACGGSVSSAPTPSKTTHALGDSFRASGDACAHDDQCSSGACSADPQHGSCGVCLDVRALGESCSGALDACRKSASCQSGVCKSLKKTAGAACSVGPKGESSDCDDELYCAVTGQVGPDMTPGVCKARGVLGGACESYPSGCVGTARCEDHTCVPPGIAQLGESCDERQCAEGLFCHDGNTCQPATIAIGGDCSSNIGLADCVPGTQCELAPNQPADGPFTMVCTVGQNEGELCASSFCKEGLFCREPHGTPGDFQCFALGREGDVCEQEQECGATLDCRAGHCESACH